MSCSATPSPADGSPRHGRTRRTTSRSARSSRTATASCRTPRARTSDTAPGAARAPSPPTGSGTGWATRSGTTRRSTSPRPPPPDPPPTRTPRSPRSPSGYATAARARAARSSSSTSAPRARNASWWPSPSWRRPRSLRRGPPLRPAARAANLGRDPRGVAAAPRPPHLHSRPQRVRLPPHGPTGPGPLIQGAGLSQRVKGEASEMNASMACLAWSFRASCSVRSWAFDTSRVHA